MVPISRAQLAALAALGAAGVGASLGVARRLGFALQRHDRLYVTG